MDRSTLSSVPELPETVALPTRAVHIGRDADGADHYVEPGQRIFVVRHEADGDELEHIEELNGRSVSTWVDYVADRRGWVVCTYDDRSMAEWLLGDQPVPQEVGR